MPLRRGVFRGSGVPDQVTAYDAWLGRPVTHIVDFIGRTPLDAADPWKNLDSPGWLARKWEPHAGKNLIVTAAMLPNSDFTLAAGAKGEYDSHWKKFAQGLVNGGRPDAIIRLGHEFNGKFYPWAAGGKEASFVAYWRKAVTAMRSVSGEEFRFDWCPLQGVSNADVSACWPGTSYVDIIGLDVYDTIYAPGLSPADRWLKMRDQRWGLTWQANFATKQGLPMSLPEWGLTVRPNDSLGGGDNPYYITQMVAWMQARNFAYASYFEVDAVDGRHRLMPVDGKIQFPNASREYRRLAGA